MKKFKPFETSSSWIFTDPDTQYQYKASSREELVRLIVAYRSQNKLPPLLRLDAVLENYLCGLPCNAGKCTPRPLERGLLQYLKGGIALLENLMYSDFVSQSEAEGRASSCVLCPCNVFPDRSTFIRWSDMIALHSVGDRKVTLQDRLGHCDGCSCVLKAKVHYGGEINLSSEEEEVIRCCNPDCWQLKVKG